MKAEGEIKPQNICIDKIGDVANISLFDNINEVKKEEGNIFEYDYYLLKVPYRDDLNTDVTNNFKAWLEIAKKNEVESIIEAPETSNRIDMLEDTINFLLGL